MVQDVKDRAATGGVPREFIRLQAIVSPDADPNLLVMKIPQHSIGAAQFGEFVEHQLDDLTGLLVGFQFHPRAGSHVANRYLVEETAATGLAPATSIESSAQDMQLGFAHRPLEPK